MISSIDRDEHECAGPDPSTLAVKRCAMQCARCNAPRPTPRNRKQDSKTSVRVERNAKRRGAEFGVEIRALMAMRMARGSRLAMMDM
eukprot:CAMPEP_0181306112 /NCGR_PEP_ID=MMETSP1101-20121128/10113_1 /TAXON_ID=46948 /ORGANISM="Rhodomonas abbreviata, Strain Caron Lab Isolate" /LENGTH=86 /DNA_ID=CAMNT_0023412121 /DNA_START=249 /DNA_END=510 /DNA_ORIENTATION=+